MKTYKFEVVASIALLVAFGVFMFCLTVLLPIAYDDGYDSRNNEVQQLQLDVQHLSVLNFELTNELKTKNCNFERWQIEDEAMQRCSKIINHLQEKTQRSKND